MDAGEPAGDGLYCFAARNSGIAFGPHGFGFAQQDAAQAGTFFFCFFFGIPGLFGWADEGAVFVLVGFADCCFGDALFGFHDGAVAVVLRSYLQAVHQDAGSACVDSVRGQGEDDLGQGQLNGVGVFQGGSSRAVSLGSM